MASSSCQRTLCEDQKHEMESSVETLSEIFEERMQWDNISRADSHVIAGVIKDVLKKGHNSDSGPKNYAYFRQEVGKLFKVPKLHKPSDQDNPLEKNELLAAFFTFLLQLLYNGTYLNVRVEDGMDNLKKELRFLIVVLGDTMVADAKLQQVRGLLAEFEAVANEAGSLMHSLIFPVQDRVLESMDEAHGVLLGQIDLLKANIIKFSNQSKGVITRKIAAMDSLFIVDSLIQDLEDLMNQDTPIVDVKDAIKELHSELIFWQSFFKDIKVPFSEIKELKESAMQIRNVAYGAEYLINSFLVGDIPLWYLTIRLPDVIHKIKLIRSGLQEKKTSDIRAKRVKKELNVEVSLQKKENSEVDDTIIVGFEERATDILDHLIGGIEHLQTISIFGMPGLGKTTFAKKLYKHPLVRYRFDKCSWCVVSQNYKRKSLLVDILIGLASDLDRARILDMEEESLAQHIHKSLKGRRYLIVMDDIWDPNAWYDLRRYFPNDGNGSRILFTSRIKDVAPPDSIIHPLPSLSNDQCWELLERRVFHNKICPPKLLEIGKEIAAKCSGLPLAVVVIAGILSAIDEEESTWKNVEGSLASYVFADTTNYVRQILELSYKHLSDHLKPCFLYLVALVNQHEIRVRMVKQLWIAEGFVSRKEKNLESVAEEYLMELIDKSLVIVTKRRSDGGVKALAIHDLLRDFCWRKAEEDNFMKLMDYNYSIYEKHHHLRGKMNVLFRGQYGYLKPFSLHVRSFLGGIEYVPSYFINMKLLRVLDLQNVYWVGELGGIEALVHLRYLAITYNEIPKSISSLVNLEFLIVNKSCEYIPSILLQMPKLRFLYISGARFDEDCNCLITNNLESLSCVSIFSLKDEEILKCSPHLRKLKCDFMPLLVEPISTHPICKLIDGICESLLIKKRAYRIPDFRFLTQLESLNMTSFSDKYEITNIYFPSNIKKLTLSGLCLPWEKMSIIGGLPNLEVLKLRDDAFVGERWDTRDGEFQQLRFLQLTQSKLIQWNASSEHFPMLRRLVLEKCHKLQEIPSEIGEIVTLQFIEVKWCQNSVVASALQIEEEQREMGNEELKAIITRLDDADSSSSFGYNPDDEENSCLQSVCPCC